jgi:hypothetical protein
MIRFIYSGNQSDITNITNLDLLFEICKLADKVTIYIHLHIFMQKITINN